jgi:hypothetical protein
MPGFNTCQLPFVISRIPVNIRIMQQNICIYMKKIYKKKENEKRKAKEKYLYISHYSFQNLHPSTSLIFFLLFSIQSYMNLNKSTSIAWF